MRTIGLVTVARSDFGLLQPILRLMPEMALKPVIYNAQPADDYRAIQEELADCAIVDISDGHHSSDTPAKIVLDTSLLLENLGRELSFNPPDILLVSGDRYEMLAGAMAALPGKIPIAHLHGGEETRGAIDNQCRHAITKLSHIHFTATQLAYARVIQMGEDPDNVHLTGSPLIDNLRYMIDARGGYDAVKQHILVTYHPETLSDQPVGEQIAQVLEALDQFAPILMTTPNADAGNSIIRNAVDEWMLKTPHRPFTFIDTLGPEKYLEAMLSAQAMVGNSSSGIIEAQYLGVPVVNIGGRQQGRESGGNVLDTPCRAEDIVANIRLALDWLPFQKGRSLYGDGHAAEEIVKVLAEVELNGDLLRKRLKRRHIPW